jgi:hypothetical protein
MGRGEGAGNFDDVVRFGLDAEIEVPEEFDPLFEVTIDVEADLIREFDALVMDAVHSGNSPLPHGSRVHGTHIPAHLMYFHVHAETADEAKELLLVWMDQAGIDLKGFQGQVIAMERV